MEKAESNTGNHWRDFLGPLRALVRGARTQVVFVKKTSVEIDHTKESLKSRFIQRRRKVSNGGGVLLERMEAGTGEAMAKELCPGNGKLTLAQANCQAMDTAQLQEILEMMNMRS